MSRILSLSVGIVLGSVVSAGAEVRLDLALAWAPTNMHVQYTEEFAQRVRELTDGEVNIVVHPSGSLGLRGPEHISAVRDGIVPMAGVSPSISAGEIPIGAFSNMPMLAPTYEEAQILFSVARPYLEEAYTRYNQKFLFVSAWTGQGLFSKTPVDSKQSLSGMKIRAGDINGLDLFGNLGAAPVQMPWAEVVPALSSGVISAVSTSSQSGVEAKFWEFMGNFAQLNWAIPIETVTINLDNWNALSPEHQQAMLAAAAELEPTFWVKTAELDARLIEQLKANGITVSAPSDEFKAEIVASAKASWEQWVGRAGPEAQQIIDDFLAKAGR